MADLQQFYSLINADIRLLSRWWQTHPISKAIVSFLFLLTFGLIAFIIYAGSYTFLLPLTRYEDYGRLTATYLFHASLIVTIWLGIGSAFISAFNFLTMKSTDLDLLEVYPIRSRVIILHSTMANILISFVWSLVVFFPLGLIVIRLFGQGLNFYSLSGIVTIFLSVIVFSTSFGNLLAFLFAAFFQKIRSPLFTLGLTLLFIYLTVVLLRFLLPPDLGRLQAAPIENFTTIFLNFPLNRYSLPTAILTDLLFGQWTSGVFWLIAFLVSLLLIVLFIQSRYFHKLRQRMASTSQPRPTARPPFFALYHSRFSLAAKDILSIVRSKEEAGYAIFLIFLVLSFFYFLSNQVGLSSSVQPQLFRYSLAWLFFYTCAYLLRLVFPLMAKEGHMAWFIFTKEIPSWRIVLQKYIAAIVISLPIFLTVILLRQDLLIALSVVLVLTLIGESLGNIFPNFSESRNPERVSTSAMGIFTLLSLLGLSYLFVKTTSDVLASSILFFSALILSLFALLILYFISNLSIRHYRF